MAQLVFGAGLNSPDVGSFLTPYANANYFISGQFQIQILKIDASRVRVRIVSLKQNGAKAEVGSRMNFDAWAFVGKSFLGSRVMVLNDQKALASAVIMSDYIFNFRTGNAEKDQNTRKLYDAILSPKLRLPALQSLNPAGSRAAIEDLFVSDLASADKEVQKEMAAGVPLEERSVIRLFQGTQTGRPEGWSFKLGIDPLNFKKRIDSDFNKRIVFTDSDGQQVRFAVPTVSAKDVFNGGYGLFRDEFDRSASVIMPLDDNGNPTDVQNGISGVGDYVVTIESKQATLRNGKKSSLLNFARRQLSREILDVLKIENTMPGDIYQNFRLYAQIILKQPSFNYIRTLSLAQLQAKMNEYLQTNADYLPGRDAEERAAWVTEHQKDLDKIVFLVHRLTADPKLTTDERIAGFMKMQFNRSMTSMFGIGEGTARTFREMGMGYLISLLPKDKLAELVDVQMRLSSAQTKSIPVPEFGTSDSAKIAQVVQFIDNLLQKGGYDVRLETYGEMSLVSGQVISIESLKNMQPIRH